MGGFTLRMKRFSICTSVRFLSGEVKLDDALAEELLNQIREANNEGYEDDLALVEVAELLDGYFQKNKNLNAYIWTLNLLGNFYNRPFSVEDGKKGALYFKTAAGAFLPLL